MRDLTWEEVPCDCCGAEDATTLFERGDLQLQLPGIFRVVECRQCGLRYMNPRPTPATVDLCYPPTYEPHALPDPDADLPRRKLWQANHDLDKRCRAIALRQPPGRILDVGCASGRFLRRLAEWGTWDRHGVELVASVAEGARRGGLDVRAGTLHEARFADGSFDVVTMWDVLEHVHSPTAQLEEAARVLAPGGLLALSTVVADAFDARLFGRYWVGYELPRHLYVFTRRTLRRLVGKAGLVVQGEEVLFGSNYAFADDVRFTLVGFGAPASTASVVFALLRSAPWRVATAPLFKLLDRIGLTTPLTVYCRHAV